MQINLLAAEGGQLKTAAYLLAVGAGTYCLASFVQTVFHRLFGHAPRVAKLHEVHVRGHHAQYARQMLTDRFIPTEQHIMWYYAVPFIPIVCVAYCLLPGIYFIAHLGGLGFSIWWHIYLHRQYHVSGVWWERFAWFREKRRLHFLHHQKPHKNFAIVEYSWDLLFGTYDDGSTATVKLNQSLEQPSICEKKIRRDERFALITNNSALPEHAKEHCTRVVNGEGNRAGWGCCACGEPCLKPFRAAVTSGPVR